MLLALLLSQLLPGQPVPSCHWREVAVWCQRGCSCTEVEARLELAQTELLKHWAACPRSPSLAGWRIFVADRPYIPGPAGEVLYGVAVLEERRVVLSRDMRGALHELVHVLEPHRPRASIHAHPSWDADGALREVDSRYQLRFRGNSP